MFNIGAVPGAISGSEEVINMSAIGSQAHQFTCLLSIALPISIEAYEDRENVYHKLMWLGSCHKSFLRFHYYSFRSVFGAQLNKLICMNWRD